MISVNDLRTGQTLEIDGNIFQVIDFQHVKPGKGAAFVRTKLRNVRSGAVTENTFRAGEKVAKAHLERREMQYLYNDGEGFVFMDNESFDQISLREEGMGDAPKYLKENMTVSVLMYQTEVIGIDLPSQVELEVVETEPGIKGDTASGGGKPATLETGIVVQVPFFINIGDVLRINTKTGEYTERA